MKTRPHRKRLRLQDHSIYGQSGRIFLVTICTSAKRRIFDDLAFGRSCIACLREISLRRENPIYAYCLMPDHVHLVIGVHEHTGLTTFVQSWRSSCTAIWRAGGGGTTFWQRSFHDRAQRRRDHLRATCEYVLQNPVRAGLVGSWREYPLSGSFEWDL